MGGIAINWRCFRPSGHKDWSDDLAHHKFTMAATDNANSGGWIKSIFRHPEIFSQFMPHSPFKINPEVLNELTVKVKILWVNSEDRSIPQWKSEGPSVRMMEQYQVSHARAQPNNHNVRDETAFWPKKAHQAPHQRRIDTPIPSFAISTGTMFQIPQSKHAISHSQRRIKRPWLTRALDNSSSMLCRSPRAHCPKETSFNRMVGIQYVI